MRRMDRYKDESNEPKLTRSNQNKELYDSIGNNTRYASFSDVNNANTIDISSKKNYNTREGYHQIKEYQDVVPTPRVKKELDEFRSLYQNRENKVYDINNVLEEARKNRIEKDELEDKRKLKNSSYNILTSLNKEELEKYRQETKNKVIHSSDDELRELIDTIASKTLAGDIKAASDLLGDLMATSIMDKVEKPEEITDTLIEGNLNVEELKKISNKSSDEEIINEEKDSKKEEDIIEKSESFYTRSMDLSAADFDLDEEFKEKKLTLGIKLLIAFIIIVIIIAVGFFIWKMQ